MVQIPVDVPDEVFTMPLDAPPPDLCRWDGEGVPAAVVIRWIDVLPFEPWSAALLAMVDPEELAPADLPRYIRLLDRAESFEAARKAPGRVRVGRTEGRRQRISRRRRRAARAHRGAADPVRRSPGRGLSRPAACYPPARHPGPVRRRLVTAKHVAKIVAGTGHLDEDECAAVESLVLDGAEHLSVHDFARRVRRAVAKIRPRKLSDRHADAAQQSDVTVDPDDDAMAWLNAKMPLLDALIVKKAVDAHAMRAKEAGDPRPLGVLRAEALRTFAEAFLTGQLTGTCPTQHGRPVEIQVCATPDALLGLTDTPAEIPGIGPVPIETIRDMAAEAKLRWLTVDGDTGRLLDRSPTTWRIPTQLHAHADATYVTSVGPHSTVPAERCDGEHLTAFPRGLTTVDNIAPMDRPWHRAKTFSGFAASRRPDVAIEWTTPLGQTITVEPYDYRLGP